MCEVAGQIWKKLFYDKYAGNHHYMNEWTKNINIQDLSDGSYKLYLDKNAWNFYNNKFAQNFALPDIVIKNTNHFKLLVYTKIEKKIKTIYTVIDLNCSRLENCIRKKIPIPNLNFIKTLCKFHLRYTMSLSGINNNYTSKMGSDSNIIMGNSKYVTKKVIEPVDFAFDECIPDYKGINVALKKYQKCSISWMIKKERSQKVIDYNVNDDVIMGNIYYDSYSQSINLLEKRKQIKFVGGALIDEVGLGKTLQMTVLSMKNNTLNTNYFREDHFFHSRATLVLCPNHLCGQWERELRGKIKKSYALDIIKIYTKTHFDKYTYEDVLNADFIIMSYSFLNNKAYTQLWSPALSIYKNFVTSIWDPATKKKVKNHFLKMGQKLCKEPLLNLYKKNPQPHLIHWHRLVVDEFHEIHSNRKYNYVANMIEHLHATHKWVVTATPFIRSNSASLLDIVDFITNYTNESGGHIFKSRLIVDYLSTDCFRRNTKKSVKNELSLPPIKDTVKWLRFTPTERIMYNAYIANPNNDRYGVYLRQLCCHPQLAEETRSSLSNCKTLEEIEIMMLSHYREEVQTAQKKFDGIKSRIEKCEDKIEEIKLNRKKRKLKKEGLINDFDNEEDIQELLVDLIDFDKDGEEKPSITIDNLKEAIATYKTKLTDAKKILEGKQTTLNFFETVVSRLRKTVAKDTVEKRSKNKLGLNLSNISPHDDVNIMDLLEADLSGEDGEDGEDDETCAICLGEIPEDDVGVTTCGHIYCHECLKSWTVKNHKCPYCQKRLSNNDVLILSYQKSKTKNKEDKSFEKLVNDVGTKSAHVVTFLKDTTKHTIVFSQWDDLLRRFGRTLEDNGINHVFCRGNCYQRDKAIRTFNQSEDIKVIMLSSDSAAAGTNLTKASQVIFLDPIYGNYEFRREQERQAVGRAHRLGQKSEIEVIRFIIKDSVEEEIYLKNEEENKAHKIHSTVQYSENSENSDTLTPTST